MKRAECEGGDVPPWGACEPLRIKRVDGSPKPEVRAGFQGEGDLKNVSTGQHRGQQNVPGRGNSLV